MKITAQYARSGSQYARTFFFPGFAMWLSVVGGRGQLFMKRPLPATQSLLVFGHNPTQTHQDVRVVCCQLSRGDKIEALP